MPQRILLVTDSFEASVPAARVAAEISTKTGSELHVVYVEPSLMGRDPSLTVIAGLSSLEASAEVYEQVLQDALETLYIGVRQAERAGGVVTEAHLRIGRPVDEVVALGKELGAGMLVVGSRGLQGMRRLVCASFSQEIVRRGRTAVLVVRQDHGSADA